MQQHRASFTSSRFTRPAAEEATTVYSYEPADDNGAYDAYSYPAYQYAEAEYVDTAYVAPDEAPTVVTTFATTADATPVARRGGAHRIPLPPTALKGRAAVLAVAAGAVVAAGQAVINDDSPATVATSEYALAAGEAPAAAVAATTAPQTAELDADSSSATPSQAPQILSVAAPADLSQFNDLLAKGQRFSEERAAREAAARRPLFALPAQGTYTSNFGTRWGVLHAGVDVANAIGTPIYAVADGKVIDSGPAAGFGMWVRLQHADGTITVYGHIDSTLVTVGQDVMAGDQIARMGNRGFSTGPHLHFEVHLPGEVKIDPLPWLASRGISLGPEMD
ncbi:M23 family metallopeptidase [Rhodococcoides fascians A25f]|uniref:M23 family metallopeptidase n=1 Tax=Rhodococcoides fascians TaxID=1828 RepID=UPI0005628C2F|nr:M23 family metallopeptidase [Rhodococcus fascians]QII07501.1 M23 family metallopeptidase [Rhodococcus fascians A25f]